MKTKLVAMTILAILFSSFLAVQVAHAQPAYCYDALIDCAESCGASGFWISLGSFITGQRWVGYAWGGGCVVGCSIGYLGCGR
jgi:hypothetical protein